MKANRSTSPALIAAIFLLFLAGSLAVAAPAARPATFDEKEIAELVAATSFKDFGRSTEGTILARFEDFDREEPASVWIAEKGSSLRAGSAQDLDRAFGSDRAKWPPYTILFTIVPVSANRLTLEVHTRFDMGLLAESRGGSVESWTLTKKGGRWSVTNHETTLNID
ncbi:MAG TPA: hypothetical protein VGS22_25940 [Thermoanaerobaculia bacterium]|jgi:hypothetical protein|nr:hypothetical protein [Thermoanaerobaculia bacterium]